MKLPIFVSLFVLTLAGCTNTIDSFQECANAGYPVMESYPRQCRADGQTFTEHIDGEKRYISENLDDCRAMLFECELNERAFFDNTGCGCVTQTTP